MAKENYLETENPESIARILGCLGDNEKARENYAQAEVYYQEAKSNVLAAGQFLAVDKIDSQLSQLDDQIVLKKMDVPWGYLKDLRTNVVYDLEGEQPILIGRNTPNNRANTIDFQVQIISRRHISINCKGLTLEDLRSLNGTTVNSSVLPYGITYSLQNSDVITLANEIVLQFFTNRPEEDKIPEKYWGILLTQSFKKYEYLVADTYFVSIDSENYIGLETKETESSLLRIRQNEGKVQFFMPNSKWDLTTIIKKLQDIKYNTYILPREEWTNAFNSPSQFVELEGTSNKIKSLGPNFQFLFKDLYAL